ncbi:hypothetical protein CDD82_4821 [Ophiocordyceps australis]|uniref:Uncharacterized protein n=1 Tax=Ophiocordyceps australis TaxID=1399860 RepID=A0A2C5Z492_9HYPO|nr:hypothetical protein CDD82_4821 [Ophiocordyceps australis]
MPPKPTGVWDNVPFLTELTLLLYEVAHRSGGLTPAAKDAIALDLERAGHAVTWEAIRQHVQKLRRPRDPTAVSKTQANDEAVSTPTKKTQPRTPGSGSARKRKTPSKSVKEMSPIEDKDGTEDVKAKAKDDQEAPRPKKVKRESSSPDGEENEI